MKKNRRIVNTVMIISMVPMLTALGILISSATGYKMFSDNAFLFPLFLGTAIFFVGSYLEAKHEDTHGIDWYIHNRKVKMGSAVTGCIMSIVVAIVSLLVF